MTCHAGSLFLILYGITAVYFSGVMVRLMLVLAPAVCCLSGVAISDILSTLTTSLKFGLAPGPRRVSLPAETSADDTGAIEEVAGSKPSKGTPAAKTSKKRISVSSGGTTDKSSDGLSSVFGVMSEKWQALPAPVAALGLFFMLGLMMLYTIHCVGVSADMYSAPSIVLQSSRSDGSVYVFDDFREAYAWLRHNTDPEAKVASW